MRARSFPAGVTARAVLFALLGVVASACGPAHVVLPSGTPEPAPEAADVWSAIATRCDRISSYRATLAMSGRIGDQRIRFKSVAIGAAVTRAGEIGLEARLSGQLLFRLGGSSEHVTLLLPQDSRIVEAPAADVLDALVGLRLTPPRLLAVLDGCISPVPTMMRAGRYGRTLKIDTADSSVFVESPSGAGTAYVRAGTFDQFQVTYRKIEAGGPRELVIESMPGHLPVIAVTLAVRDFAVNPDLGPALFTVTVPPDGRPMSLDELRRSRF